ncbi:MAG: hypothetical protein AM325_001320 [Candidatus Thorarchaeota archaeon SMTZ1-45]|nr:MAG: hypothetical protein AM325_03140 [Candidatus Thorarchaeota archaeon SMTZ1-45]
MTSFKNLTRSQMLERAKDHIFSSGLQDSANALCVTNMKYGLAKFHWVQNQHSLEPDATFVSAPDATVTRNVRRWQSGLGYGGKLSWGDGKQKLVFLDAMPNACGMLVGGLETLPPMHALIENISTVLSTDEIIDGIPIEWDFAVSNHFIDLFRYKPVDNSADSEYDYVFIIHGSVPELKGDNDTKFGFGLYRHRSKKLNDMSEEIDTPFGKTWVVIDENASEYLQLNDFACELSMKKRLKAAEAIFGEFTEICNPIHQGLRNMNEHLLGCQDIHGKDNDDLLPIALRADLPAYLVRGHPNFNEDIIEHLGFTRRAEKHNVKHRLLNTNILPHGGGYKFQSILGIEQVIEASNGTRYYITDMATGHESRKVFSNPRELEYTYRGREVVRRTLDLQMCEIVARLMPRTVLKI